MGLRRGRGRGLGRRDQGTTISTSKKATSKTGECAVQLRCEKRYFAIVWRATEYFTYKVVPYKEMDLEIRTLVSRQVPTYISEYLGAGGTTTLSLSLSVLYMVAT